MENPDASPYQTDFLAPFDLSTCAQRIENLTEEGRFFAFDWEHRIKAKVSQTDAHSATFTIHKIQMSNARITIAPVVALRGTLRTEANNATKIKGEAYTNWLGYAFTFGLVGLLLTMAPASALVFSPSAGLKALAALIVIVVPAIIYGVSRYFLDFRKKELLGILAGAFEKDSAQFPKQKSPHVGVGGI